MEEAIKQALENATRDANALLAVLRTAQELDSEPHVRSAIALSESIHTLLRGAVFRATYGRDRAHLMSFEDHFMPDDEELGREIRDDEVRQEIQDEEMRDLFDD